MRAGNVFLKNKYGIIYHLFRCIIIYVIIYIMYSFKYNYQRNNS
jgi:hypothetical protein